MRMMLRIHIDATHGSAALKSGALQQAIGGFIAKFKPEATYFGLESGQRTGFFVFDMKDSEQCPEVAEAFFDTGCVEYVFSPGGEGLAFLRVEHDRHDEAGCRGDAQA